MILNKSRPNNSLFKLLRLSPKQNLTPSLSPSLNHPKSHQIEQGNDGLDEHEPDDTNDDTFVIAYIG